MIELVIFDCDGVLVDSEVTSAKILVEKLADLDIHMTREHVYRNFVGQSFPKVAAKIRANSHRDLPEDFEESYRVALAEAFLTELKVTEGVIDVLDTLTCARCIATSSSPPRLKRSMEICGLEPYFGKNVFTASQVKNGKPAPDLFQLAAKTLGVDPANCLVLEDSLAGIRAAQAAEMLVWRYTGGSHFDGFTSTEFDTPEGVPHFDNWGEFYLMAPDLKGCKVTHG